MKYQTCLAMLGGLGVSVLSLSACNFSQDRDAINYSDSDSVSLINASVETQPVATDGDAADDPAIWLHPSNPERSLVIGTNKQSGLAVYNLRGEQIQFLEHGLPNNVDIRQNVTVKGKVLDIGAFSDRSDNTIGWFTITENGIELLAHFQVNEEPYGFCLGHYNNSTMAFVTYKNGVIEQYKLSNETADDALVLTMQASYQFDTQLEGCVVDDTHQRLFVGEEERGIWAFDGIQTGLDVPTLIDEVGSKNGIVADIEGLALYHSEKPLLLASSQGNDSFAVYQAMPPYQFVTRFRINANENVDGAQETDGIEVTHIALPGFPVGMIVAQDGFNNDGMQNFKYAPLNILVE